MGAQRVQPDPEVRRLQDRIYRRTDMLSPMRGRYMAVAVILTIWLLGAAYAYFVVGGAQVEQPELMRRALAFGPLYGPLELERIGRNGRITLAGDFRVPVDSALLVAAAIPLGLSGLILFGDMSRRERWGRYVAQARKHATAQGRPALEEAQRTMRLKGPGVPLGLVDGTTIGVPYGTDRGQIAVIGPNRSGKGLHLTEALLSWPGAAVVVDPRGEQWDRTSGHRATLGPVFKVPVQYLDLAEYFTLTDPFDLQELHRQLLRTWQDKEPIFAEKSLALFRAAVATGRATNQHPLALLAEWTQQTPALALEQAAEHAPGEVAQFTDGVPLAELTSNRFALSAWGTFTSRFSPFVPHIHTISSPGLPADWIRQRATIYITYPLDQLRTAGGLVSAIVAGLFKAQMRAGKGIGFTLFAIDELPVTALYNLDVYLSTGGGSGAMFLLYMQTLSQLYEVYGPYGAETVLGNCHHQVYYPPRDPKTAAYISEMFGTELQFTETISQSQGSSSSSSSAGSSQQQSISTSQSIRPALEVPAALALPEAATVLFSTLSGRQFRLIAERMNPIPRLATLPPPAALIRLRRHSDGPTASGRATRPAPTPVPQVPLAPPGPPEPMPPRRQRETPPAQARQEQAEQPQVQPAQAEQPQATPPPTPAEKPPRKEKFF